MYDTLTNTPGDRRCYTLVVDASSGSAVGLTVSLIPVIVQRRRPRFKNLSEICGLANHNDTLLQPLILSIEVDQWTST